MAGVGTAGGGARVIPGTDPIGLLRVMAAVQPSLRQGAGGGDEGAVIGLAMRSFEAIIIEALLERGRAVRPGGEIAASDPPRAGEPAADAEGLPLDPAPLDPGAPAERAREQPISEGAVIEREAERTGVDVRLLRALRRAENGGPGREFGVLSVPAPGLEAQARVAANTVRNTAQRYARQGGEVLDSTTGRYSEGFLRFLSARYAPVGATTDPAGLNRHHARNLIALYRQAHERAG